MVELKTSTEAVDLQRVKNLIKMVGYEIIRDEGDLFVVQDESCIPIYCCLQTNVLLNSVPCHRANRETLTSEVLFRMLDASNGLSTSNFRLSEVSDGKVQITLSNFCKLQELGNDDADDIWSALNFLEIDVVKARDILKDIL
jgi:hypothetical protein